MKYLCIRGESLVNFSLDSVEKTDFKRTLSRNRSSYITHLNQPRPFSELSLFSLVLSSTSTDNNVVEWRACVFRRELLPLPWPPDLHLLRRLHNGAATSSVILTNYTPIWIKYDSERRTFELFVWSWGVRPPVNFRWCLASDSLFIVIPNCDSH